MDNSTSVDANIHGNTQIEGGNDRLSLKYVGDESSKITDSIFNTLIGNITSETEQFNEVSILSKHKSCFDHNEHNIPFYEILDMGDIESILNKEMYKFLSIQMRNFRSEETQKPYFFLSFDKCQQLKAVNIQEIPSQACNNPENDKVGKTLKYFKQDFQGNEGCFFLVKMVNEEKEFKFKFFKVEYNQITSSNELEIPLGQPIYEITLKEKARVLTYEHCTFTNTHKKGETLKEELDKRLGSIGSLIGEKSGLSTKLIGSANDGNQIVSSLISISENNDTKKVWPLKYVDHDFDKKNNQLKITLSSIEEYNEDEPIKTLYLSCSIERKVELRSILGMEDSITRKYCNLTNSDGVKLVDDNILRSIEKITSYTCYIIIFGKMIKVKVGNIFEFVNQEEQLLEIMREKFMGDGTSKGGGFLGIGDLIKQGYRDFTDFRTYISNYMKLAVKKIKNAIKIRYVRGIGDIPPINEQLLDYERFLNEYASEQKLNELEEQVKALIVKEITEDKKEMVYFYNFKNVFTDKIYYQDQNEADFHSLNGKEKVFMDTILEQPFKWSILGDIKTLQRGYIPSYLADYLQDSNFTPISTIEEEKEDTIIPWLSTDPCLSNNIVIDNNETGFFEGIADTEGSIFNSVIELITAKITEISGNEFFKKFAPEGLTTFLEELSADINVQLQEINEAIKKIFFTNFFRNIETAQEEDALSVLTERFKLDKSARNLLEGKSDELQIKYNIVTKRINEYYKDDYKMNERRKIIIKHNNNYYWILGAAQQDEEMVISRNPMKEFTVYYTKLTIENNKGHFNSIKSFKLPLKQEKPWRPGYDAPKLKEVLKHLDLDPNSVIYEFTEMEQRSFIDIQTPHLFLPKVDKFSDTPGDEILKSFLLVDPHQYPQKEKSLIYIHNNYQYQKLSPAERISDPIQFYQKQQEYLKGLQGDDGKLFYTSFYDKQNSKAYVITSDEHGFMIDNNNEIKDITVHTGGKKRRVFKRKQFGGSENFIPMSDFSQRVLESLELFSLTDDNLDSDKRLPNFTEFLRPDSLNETTKISWKIKRLLQEIKNQNSMRDHSLELIKGLTTNLDQSISSLALNINDKFDLSKIKFDLDYYKKSVEEKCEELGIENYMKELRKFLEEENKYTEDQIDNILENIEDASYKGIREQFIKHLQNLQKENIKENAELYGEPTINDLDHALLRKTSELVGPQQKSEDLSSLTSYRSSILDSALHEPIQKLRIQEKITKIINYIPPEEFVESLNTDFVLEIEKITNTNQRIGIILQKINKVLSNSTKEKVKDIEILETIFNKSYLRENIEEVYNYILDDQKYQLNKREEEQETVNYRDPYKLLIDGLSGNYFSSTSEMVIPLEPSDSTGRTLWQRFTSKFLTFMNYFKEFSGYEDERNRLGIYLSVPRDLFKTDNSSFNNFIQSIFKEKPNDFDIFLYKYSLVDKKNEMIKCTTMNNNPLHFSPLTEDEIRQAKDFNYQHSGVNYFVGDTEVGHLDSTKQRIHLPFDFKNGEQITYFLTNILSKLDENEELVKLLNKLPEIPDLLLKGDNDMSKKKIFFKLNIDAIIISLILINIRNLIDINKISFKEPDEDYLIVHKLLHKLEGSELFKSQDERVATGGRLKRRTRVSLKKKNKMVPESRKIKASKKRRL